MCVVNPWINVVPRVTPQVYSASLDGTIRLWNVADAAMIEVRRRVRRLS